jgi:hypothetical protein
MTIQNYRLKSCNGPYNSKSNPGSRYWQLTLLGLEDNQIYTTNVDVSMQNFQNWEKIISSKDTFILGNIIIKSSSRKLINADSKPKIIERIPAIKPQAVIEPAENMFNKLFD